MISLVTIANYSIISLSKMSIAIITNYQILNLRVIPINDKKITIKFKKYF